MSEDARGWGFPGASRKAHYFVGATSLCRRWMFTGELKDTAAGSPDDCVTCTRLVRKLAEEARP